MRMIGVVSLLTVVSEQRKSPGSRSEKEVRLAFQEIVYSASRKRVQM
jgi:hypothetical protein